MVQKSSEFHIQLAPPAVASEPVGQPGTGYYVIKRLIDVVGSALALLVLFLPMLIIAVLIRFDSTGGIFFVQKRVGMKRTRVNGVDLWQQTTFDCVKFRSMVKNADTDIHRNFVKTLIHNKAHLDLNEGGEKKLCKLTHDPRVTRFGRFLRKTSLDELPQFWNVLKGDMSLVGPRPAIPYELEDYKPWYHRRFLAQPGLTGLWQVSARSSADFDGMVRYDLLYVKNRSLWLDLKILFKTPIVVILCKSAG